jgi:hypothetical protein
MHIELKPQLQPFDITGLRTFVRDQQARLNNLNKIIGTANERIAALRKAAAPPPKGVSPAERQVYQTVAERQLISQIGDIRREVDKELVSVVNAMQGAADEAKVRAERHHDLFSILRNAKTGTGDGRAAVEAAQLRAAYATILESTGPVELAKWAQQAIDTGDAILADAVVRECGARKQDERPFLTATLLKLLPNAEHPQAMALLNQVIDLAQQGGIAYSEFERGRYNSVARIALGLKARQNIDEVIGEDGAILV